MAEVTDTKGRKLSIREMDPGDELDLFEACGKNSLNQAWLGMAMLACSVSAIDGIPVLFPRSKDDVKALARTLGHEGIAAVAAHQRGDGAEAEASDVEVAKNS